jgi:hypothetical protein
MMWWMVLVSGDELLGKKWTLFCGARCRYWPIATDFAAQTNVGCWGHSDRHSSGRRARREIADVEHRPQQLGLRQDGLRLRHHVGSRMLAAGNVIVEQRLQLGYALEDFPDWIVDRQWPLKLASL